MYEMEISSDNKLKVYNSKDKLVLSLSHASDMNVKNSHSQTFDEIDDMMSFIEQMSKQEQNNIAYHFSPVAYEIINEHYIKLYYNSHVSNA